MTKVVSWDNFSINDGTNYRAAILYSHSLPSVSPVFIERTNADALVGNVSQPARQLPELGIAVEAGSIATIQTQFNPRDKRAKALVISDDDGSNQRYVMAYCVALDQVPGSGGVAFVATLFAHGDVYWRATTATTVSSSLTASGQTVAVSNDGDAVAYPKITLTPTSAKSSGNGNVYRQFWAVPWSFNRGARREAVDIVNASLDTQTGSTNFASATGDDIRVYVDGVAVDFWLSAPNTANTKLWCNLDFAAGVSLTLDGAVSDSATSLVFNESIASLPSAGILHFTGNDEIVTYTAKNEATKTVSGVTRGAKGSSAASQSDAAAVAWLQHDVWVTYGDSSLAAYVPDDTYKPAFDIATSTNTSWVFSDFGDDERLRSGAWVPGAGIGGNTADSGYCFTRDFSGGGSELVTPWAVLGLWQSGDGVNRWVFHSPRGISAGSFTNGKKYSLTDAAAASFAGVDSASDGNNWIEESAISATTVAATWQSWSATVSGLYTASQKETKYLALRIGRSEGDTETYGVMCGDVTVTLQNGIASVGIGEIDAYSAGITIANSTTGYSVRWQGHAPLNDGLEIDTEAKTVTLLADNSSALDGLTIVGGVRTDWLQLAVGSNTITVTEGGLAGLDIDIEFKKRYYD